MPEPARTSEVAGFRVQHFASLDSTNAYLLAEARTGAPSGLVAVAGHQTAGRGRLDRTWEAPPGSSLLVSVLVRDASGGAGAHRVVMAAALALADAVETVAGVGVGLKWPNDLVVGERKLAGVLAEQEGDALVVGAGCNVAWESFPPDLAATATSCSLEAGRPVAVDDLLTAYLDALAGRLAAPDAVVPAYRDRLVTLGRRVGVERAGDTLVGEAVHVDADGALVVRADDGTEERVTAGDVVHLRPA